METETSLSADLRSITPRRDCCLSPGKGTSCAAASGGRDPGVRGHGSRSGTEVWAGSGRPCSPGPGRASAEADPGLQREAGSPLSEEADRGTSPSAEGLRLPAGTLRRSLNEDDRSADIRG